MERGDWGGVQLRRMTSASPFAIDLSHVAKTYRGGVQALRGIEMRVHKGEVFGLLGPNGAGKSTLVKILMTVISPTRADGTMLGERIGHKATLRRVGYLPEHHRFPDYLTGEQVVDFYGALSGVPRAHRRKRTGELLELVGMKDWAKTKVRGYSKGMRQRVGIAQALVNDPELVVLDEPTDGVDPVGRRDIRAICARLREGGMTVFLNSHLLSELELVCDRVAILVQGRVSSQGTIDELTRDKQYYELELQATADEAASVWAAVMSRVSGGPRCDVLGSVLRVATTDARSVQPIVDAVRHHGGILRTLRGVRPSLEDLFMAAVVDQSTGKALAPGADRSK